jgi:FlgD Ig-like domain
MRPVRTLLASIALVAMGFSSQPARADHCAAKAQVSPVPGAPDQFRITTSHGTTIARSPKSPEAMRAGAIFTINLLDGTFDADNNALTAQDTLIVPIGSTVRWHLVTGLHTVTNGHDSGDLAAGTRFDYFMEPAHPDFDSLFTAPTTVYFFCYFHEPVMAGALIVRQNADVPGSGASPFAEFSRPPAPNPARGAVSFAITLPHEQAVDLAIVDVAGRRIASLAHDRLTAGEHPFRWDGRTNDGDRAAVGQYRVVFRAGGTVQSRAFSLLH